MYFLSDCCPLTCYCCHWLLSLWLLIVVVVVAAAAVLAVAVADVVAVYIVYAPLAAQFVDIFGQRQRVHEFLLKLDTHTVRHTHTHTVIHTHTVTLALWDARHMFGLKKYTWTFLNSSCRRRPFDARILTHAHTRTHLYVLQPCHCRPTPYPHAPLVPGPLLLSLMYLFCFLLLFLLSFYSRICVSNMCDIKPIPLLLPSPHSPHADCAVNYLS